MIECLKINTLLAPNYKCKIIEVKFKDGMVPLIMANHQMILYKLIEHTRLPFAL